MKFSTILSGAIFASVALARPSTLADRIARRNGQQRNGRPMIAAAGPTDGPITEGETNATHVDYSSNWSGAVLTAPPSGQTFDYVVGTFTVPTPSGSAGSASAWVGIDGDTYGNAILQAGVDFTISSSGKVSYDSWYEWYPDYAYDFSGFSVAAGNVITITISSSSSSAGTVTLANTSTGKSVSKSLTAPSSSSHLGGQNAEWIVEDYEEGSSLVTFANFGTVTFTGASAKGSGGTSVGLTGADVIDIEQNGKVLTSVTIESASSVQIKYV